MADKPQEKSYIKQVAHFYFAPDVRSLGTLIYLAIFGYFSLFYIDNILLALKFLIYILFGHTALSGTAFLFTGMLFVISLALPFFISFYSIFVLHKVWDKPTWSSYVKWLMTGLIILGSVCIIILSDTTARFAARHPSMQSFIEDTGLTGKI
jgi:hypothetical protein